MSAQSVIGTAMIFCDLISELESDVKAAVDELFKAAWTNQTHEQDLLLTDQHGYYYDLLAKPAVREKGKLSPYVIGQGEIGFGEDTFYRFIDWYRKSPSLAKSDFEKQLVDDEEKREQEELTVQLEQSIYLRFWESETLLKQYYQLSALASGKPYDWHLKIPGNPRVGKHYVIREQIRDQVKTICPAFYDLVKGNYLTQLRNAIAHSQFYIFKRNIYFLNFSEDSKDFALLKGMTFDEWYRTFHTTLLLHNATIGAFHHYRELYKERTLANDNRISIRITKQDGSESFPDFGIRRDCNKWIYRQNLDEEDLKQSTD